MSPAKRKAWIGLAREMRDIRNRGRGNTDPADEAKQQAWLAEGRAAYLVMCRRLEMDPIDLLDLLMPKLQDFHGYLWAHALDALEVFDAEDAAERALVAVTVGGKPWWTDGEALWADGRPAPYCPCRVHKGALAIAGTEIPEATIAGPFVHRLHPHAAADGDRSINGHRPRVLVRRDGTRVSVDPRFNPLLRGGKLEQADGPLSAIRVTVRGEIVAYVMPCRR